MVPTKPLVSDKKFLLFGFLLTLFSTFGQTSFLSVFTPIFQKKFSLSPGEIGFYYSFATLCSAITISYTGVWIDRIGLKKYTFFVLFLFILAGICMSNLFLPICLFFGYYLLRFSCQGLMSHISMVSMARYFHENRGKALSIAALGYPIGDASFPLIIAIVLSCLNLQATWYFISFFGLFVLFPIFSLLLQNHSQRHLEYTKILEQNSQEDKGKTPKEVLRDWKFYCITFGVLAPGFINTGIFFQNASLIEMKSWPANIFAVSLINYGIGNILGSTIIGLLTDKYKSTRVIAYYLFPMLIGLSILLSVHSVYAIFLFMLGIGICQGGSSIVVAAVWAELYGPKYLGTIKSWISTVKVLFTAISPVLFGILIDKKWSFTNILVGCCFYTILSISLLGIVTFKTHKSFSLNIK